MRFQIFITVCSMLVFTNCAREDILPATDISAAELTDLQADYQSAMDYLNAQSTLPENSCITSFNETEFEAALAKEAAYLEEVVAGKILAPNILHVPGDFATIQAAIDVAISKTIILIEAGTYDENLLIDGKQSLSLRAMPGAVVNGFIQVSNSNNVLIFGLSINIPTNTSSGIRLTTSQNIRLIGNHLVCLGSTFSSLQGIFISSNNCTIKSNSVSIENGTPNGHCIGIYVASGGNLFIKGNTVIRVNQDIFGWGIWLVESLVPPTGYREIKRNKLNGLGIGIEIDEASGCLIHLNECSDNDILGIYLATGCGGNTVTQNIALNNGLCDIDEDYPDPDNPNIIFDNMADCVGDGFNDGFTNGLPK
jgi:parallel beta-helix repeat protein